MSSININFILEAIVKFKKIIMLAAVLLCAGAAAGAYIVFMPGGLYEYSESPEFCAKCHLHDGHYKDFNHAAAHRGKKCVDCHLPNDNKIEHLFWKSVDGNKDLALFFAGNFSDTPRLSAHGKKVVQNNCIRCHSEVVFKLDMAGRDCVSCHRSIRHKTAGIF
jgi:cytochrome c nitrite reductase small subunit